MRRIDPDFVDNRLPPEWREKARLAAGRIQTEYERLYKGSAATSDEARTRKEALSKAVEAEADVWQDKALKQILMDASEGKCWYCEAAVAQRADNAVDHFRPKNRVHGESDHPGYFWLACDWENYRFACTFCNSSRRTEDTAGGKQDHFPLWDKAKRVRPPEQQTTGEQPLLLDPYAVADANFLTFDVDGTAVPRYSERDNKYLYDRAAESIERYHLNRPEYRTRRRDLMSAVRRAIKDADMFWERYNGKDLSAEQAYRAAIRHILEKLDRRAEFTAAVRAALASRRGTSTAANDVLSAG
jgi:uncharacterized protein (TIGR02646 family)